MLNCPLCHDCFAHRPNPPISLVVHLLTWHKQTTVRFDDADRAGVSGWKGAAWSPSLVCCCGFTGSVMAIYNHLCAQEDPVAHFAAARLASAAGASQRK